MSTMLENHLEQIALSAAAIADLPFPPPKIFTNALLHPHDITTLIRDTEAHERALFTVVPPEQTPHESNTRKSTVFNLEPSKSATSSYKGPRSTSAVGRILGVDLMNQIGKGLGNGRDRTEVDVEVLLRGAEKLCAVYPIQGALERINSLRTRHEQLSSSIGRYEAKVAKQASQLNRMNHPEDFDEVDNDQDYEDDYPITEDVTISKEELAREEQEMRELEAKKRGLEDRVSGMERDLGGLLR